MSVKFNKIFLSFCSCKIILLSMQNCSYFADHPFHFTKYSILPCQKNTGRKFTFREALLAKINTNMIRFRQQISTVDSASAISPFTSIAVSAGNSIFTRPEGIRISFIVHPVILTKTITNYVIAPRSYGLRNRFLSLPEGVIGLSHFSQRR